MASIVCRLIGTHKEAIMTTTEPKLEQRDKQPYIAIRRQVTRQELGPVLGDQVVGQVFAWLASKGLAPAGAPFFRYLAIDMAGEGYFDVEVGVPVEPAVPGDGNASAGVLPAGRYAVLVNSGPYDDLVDAHTALHAWGEANGIVWQTSDNGNEPGVMLESYETNPAEEPDPQKWQTEIAYLVADTPTR
jgi:effector-binding domain-containing protein